MLALAKAKRLGREFQYMLVPNRLRNLLYAPLLDRFKEKDAGSVSLFHSFFTEEVSLT